MNEQRTRQAIRKFCDALANLETEITTSTADRKSRNSVLLSFVLLFETVWKALKGLLILQEGVEASSPKEVLRQAFQVDWLGSSDATWLDMADDRNLVAHTYSEEQAITIYERVVQRYAPALRALHEVLKAKAPRLFEELAP